MKTHLRIVLGIVLGIVAVSIFRVVPVQAVPFIVASEVKDTGGYYGWGADTALTIAATSTTAAALSAGAYTVTCVTAGYADIGATGVVATTSERRIPADFPYPLMVKAGSTDTIFAFIGDSASGKCILSNDVY